MTDTVTEEEKDPDIELFVKVGTFWIIFFMHTKEKRKNTKK